MLRTTARKSICFWIVAIFFVCAVARAQDAATIIGTVTDPSGAVVPNANIAVSNPDKGFKRLLVSDSAGDYVAAKVPIGSYVVTAEAAGFRKLVRSGITLDVGQLLRVDLQLQVGATTQEVTIVGNVPHVETDSGTLSQVVTGSQMVDLDLNGRAFDNLELLVAGASEANNTTFTNSIQPTINFNGVYYFFNRSEIDGQPNMDMGSGGAGNDLVPSVDSIAQFRITTDNYGAEQGQGAGSKIEVATKSGTREFHGGAYEFNRNTKFNSNDFFANRVIAPVGGNAPKVPLQWNDFGYNLGGPFYIPGAYNKNKDKTFFFWSQEIHRYLSGAVINNNVPSQMERQGNFSQCDPNSANYNSVVAAGCILPKIPGSGGQLYPNDIVPVNPNATDLLNAYVPLPNSGPIDYVSAPKVPNDFDEEQIRVDQNLSDKTMLFARFTHDGWYLPSIPPGHSSPTNGAGMFDTLRLDKHQPGLGFAFHLTHSFSSRLMSETILGYIQDRLIFTGPVALPANIAGSVDKPSSWVMQDIFPADQSNPLLPGIVVSGGGPSITTSSSNVPQGTNAAPTYDLKENLVGVVGKHTLKTGFFGQRYHKNELGGFFTNGFLYFTGGGFPGSTGNGYADMDIGAITEFTEGTQTLNGTPVGGYVKYYFTSTDFEPYFQDDWKVNHKLTLNLGVRYYFYQPVHEVSRPTKDATFYPSLYNPSVQAQLNAAGYIVAGTGDWYNNYGNGLVACGQAGTPIGCAQATHGNVAPRFGFAFDPTGSGKTVIRGGYGIFYDIGSAGTAGASESQEGNAPVALTSVALNISGYSNIVPGNLAPVSMTALAGISKWPSVQQFNLTAQHEFRGNNLLSVAYVGTLGRHTAITQQLNQVAEGVSTENVPALAGATDCDSSGNCQVQTILENKLQSVNFFVPYRGYSTISEYANAGKSNYNALQVVGTHPFGHGLMVQAAYSWSHWLDIGSSGGDGCVDSTNLERCYANADYNRTQSLALSCVYSLPFLNHPSGTFASKALSEGLGGWRISGITSIFSGLPFNPSCGVSGYATAIGGSMLCNSLGPLKIQKGTINYAPYGPTPSWFTPGIYGQPNQSQLASSGEPGMFGYMSRNTMTGPGRNNWDMALLKDFGLPWRGGERSRLEFRFETFNTFNHPQWYAVNAGCSGNTGFGQPCSGSNNPSVGTVSSDWSARVLQLGIKLTF